MKKFTTCLLLIAMLMSLASIGAFATEETVIKPDTSWYTDDAYTANGGAYLLDDASDVLGFSNLLAGIGVDKPQNFEGKTVELTASVDLANNEWGLLEGALNDDKTRPESREPLEFPVLQNYGFWGTFNGNGNTISGIKFDAYVNDDVDAHDCTLFGIVPKGKTAVVKNLAIDSSFVEVSYFSGMIFSTIEGTATIDTVYLGKEAKLNGCGQSIGTLAGRVMPSGDLTIKNCVIEGTHIDDWQKNRFRGGIVSTSYGKLTIEDTAFYGSMTKYLGGIKASTQHAGIIQVVGKDDKCKDAGYAPSLTLKNVIVCANISNAYSEAGKDLKKVVYIMQKPGPGVELNVDNVFYVQSTMPIMGYEGEKIDRASLMGTGAKKFLSEKGLSTWYATDRYTVPTAIMSILYPDVVIETETEAVTTDPIETQDTAPETSDVAADTTADAKGGCGSSIALTFPVVLVSAALGVCLTKKKED